MWQDGAQHPPKNTIPRYPNHRKNLVFTDHQKKTRQIPQFQESQKQVSLFRSCTLCVQGSAQKQDVPRVAETVPRAVQIRALSSEGGTLQLVTHRFQ